MRKIGYSLAILALSTLITGCPSRTVARYPNTAKNIPLMREVTTHFALDNTPDHKLIKKEMHYYLSHKEYLDTLMTNAKPYLFYVYQQTALRHMPAEIALLPMVESNYAPYGISSTGATGLWQMMPGTASGFGIRINWWYDGRRDIKASTTAALNYISYLHNRFGSWLLTIAAYNSGEGTVLSAIRYNKRHHLPTDYWALKLPKQTEYYVPKLLALAHLYASPTNYSLHLPTIPNHAYFKGVIMHGQISFKHIVAYSHTDLTKIRQLNPGFRRWATVPNKTYTLLLPSNKVATYLANLSQHKNNLITWIHHDVKSGESLTSIAMNYHTHPIVIKTVNHLKTDVIQPRQTLLVPMTYNQKHAHLLIKKTSKIIAEDRLPGPKRVVHIVAKNDTLSSISVRYHVKPSQIIYWNKLAYNSKLHIEQPLTIWVHHKTRRPVFYTYKVKHGDNLLRIAQRFNTKISEIQRVNHLRGDLIQVGLELNIPRLPGHHAQYEAMATKLNNEDSA